LQPRIEQLEDRTLLSVTQPNGLEFQANKYTTGNEQYAEVAADAAGDFVIAWSAYAEDGSGTGVYAQRYKSTGAGQNEFKVNTYTTGNESHPTVAMDSAGDFVVVWQSSYEDRSGYGIYAQLYGAGGNLVGSEFRVNTYTTNNQINPSVSMDSAGDFVVAWQSFYQDGSGYGVYAQRYNATATAQGSEFQVNTDTLSTQSNPSVAMDSTGDFVVAWQSLSQDGSSYGVYAQQFNSAGAPGGEFQVNTTTANSQGHPSVAMDSSGDFIVAWQSYGQDGNKYGIFAQRYNNARVPQGSEFQVNTYTIGFQRNPSVAMDAAGDTVITWQSYGQDTSKYGVYAQRYDPNGLIQQSEFLVNTFTTGNQALPSVDMDATGDFIVAWQSYGQDPSQYGVYAQRYLAVGTPPAITLINQPVSFTAHQGPALIDANIDLTDTESSTLNSATVTIATGFDPAQDVLSFTPQGNISGSFNSTTGAFILTGVDTVADYRAAIETVTYFCANVSKTTSSSRTISYVVNDGVNFSNVPTLTINLLQSGPATHLVLLSQPPTTVVSGASFGFTVAAEDALGNVVSGFTDGVTIVLGTNPNNATVGGDETVAATGGLAIFTGLTLDVVGTGYTLDAVSGSLIAATTTPIKVTAGVATQLVLLNQPPSTLAAGATFALTAVAEDASGNVATGFTGSVTAALANNPGGSTVGGTSTVSAASGLAVFPNLSLNKVGNGYTLIIKSTNLGSATTGSIKVIPGAASQVAINPLLATNVTVGAPFGFTASVEDAQGNVVTSYSGNVTVAISTNPGSGTLSGTKTVSSTSGVAVFSGLSLNTVAAGYKLSVATGTISPLILGPFNVTAPGVATHLIVEKGPTSVAPGAAFGVTVEAEDDFGTLDSSFAGGVSIALANNAGQSTLSGTLSTTASAGVATFAGLSLNNPGLGYTLQTSSSGLTAGVSSPFNVVGTLTINGTGSSESVQVSFIDSTDFQVVLNGGTPVVYSTIAATKLVYNRASTTTQLIFSDIFNTYTATQSLAATELVGDGFEFDANGVDTLYVYATNGKSTATITVDSGAGNNFYVGDAEGDYSYLGDPIQRIYSELAGFASETVTGSAGTTYAYIYSMSNATFIGDPSGSSLKSTGMSVTLNKFSQIYAVGAEDGTDFVTLHSSGGSFVAQPSFSYVSGTASGSPFFIGALFAANVVGLASNSTDQAFFYSYPDDEFDGAQASSVLSGDATDFADFSTFQVRATSFQSLTVLESGAGTDVVNLTAPRNGTFTETASASTLAVGGVAVITINTYFVDEGILVAVPSQINVTGDSSNTAYLYDSPGANSLNVLGKTATLVTPVNTVVVSKFGGVNAFCQNGTNDTVHVQALDLALQTIGSWTTV
jgi:hypothetical protein